MATIKATLNTTPKATAKAETKPETKPETAPKSEGEGEGESKSKKANMPNRPYDELEKAITKSPDLLDELKAKAKSLLMAQIESNIKALQSISKSTAPVGAFIRLSRAAQSNMVLQISSGSLEQRLGYDRENYTSFATPENAVQALIYTLSAFLGYDETAKACGVHTATAPKSKAKSPKATLELDF